MKKSWKNASGAIARRGSGSGHSGLSRLKTGSQSIRGRISEPIPIRSPLDEELRLKGAEMEASPSKLQSVGDDSLLPGTRDSHGSSISPRASAQQPSTQQGGNPASVKMLPDRGYKGEEAPVASSSDLANPLRYSMISESTERSRSSLGPQRKNSTFRGAFGKLFNRRRRAENQDTPSSDATPTSEAFNHLAGESVRTSEPKLMSKGQLDPSPQQYQNLDARRRNSLPISEFDRALRSHSIRPKDVMAIQGARNSANIKLGTSHTNFDGAYILSTRFSVRDDEDLAGLTPRPGARRPKTESPVSEEQPSQSEGRKKHDGIGDSNRRSRSASDVFSTTEPQGRRGNDEMRYWREGHDPNYQPRITLDHTEDVDTNSPTSRTRDAAARTPRSPVQPFVFGDMQTMNEMAGMKITQAASIETRICSLEAKLQELEIAMGQLGEARLQDLAGSTERPSQWAVLPTDRRLRLTDEEIERGQSRLRPTSSNDRASTMPPRVMSGVHPQNKDRSVALTIDHYLTLMALIETERSSRQALEAQVKGLTRRVKELTRSSQDTTTLLTGTPRHHPVVHKGDSILETSAFDLDTSEEENEAMAFKAFTAGQEDSGIGHLHKFHDEGREDNGRDNGRGLRKRVPTEENDYTSSAFGHEIDEAELDRSQKTEAFRLSETTHEQRPAVFL